MQLVLQNNKNMTTLCQTRQINTSHHSPISHVYSVHNGYLYLGSLYARLQPPLRCYLGLSKTKGSKAMAATLGLSAGESPSENGTDKQKRFLPLFSWVSCCSKVTWMWSATVSKRIIRWNLWSDVNKPGQSVVWKNHYAEPDILDNFGGNRPLGMWHRSLRD